MALPNWLTVFLLGTYFGQREITRAPGPAAAWIACLVAFTLAWLAVAPHLPFTEGFPFSRPSSPGPLAAIVVSAAISLLYVVFTLLAFAIFTKFNAPWLVTFIAKNTLIVFLVHMPVYYVAVRWLPERTLGHIWRSVIIFVICLPCLAVVSDLIRRSALVTAVRAWCYVRLVGGDPAFPGALSS